MPECAGASSGVCKCGSARIGGQQLTSLKRTQHEPVENLVPGCESPAQDSEDSEVDSGVRSEAKARARDAASAAAANILAKKLAEKKPSKDVKSKSPRQIVPGCQGPAKPRQVVPGCQS